MSEIPKVCSIEPFRYQVTPQPDGLQGASGSQINEQQIEDYLNRLRVAVCDDLTDLFDNVFSFLALTDTPKSYVGAGGQVVRVNAAETALEFDDFDFLGLIDTPDTYAGQAGKAVVVNPSATGLIFDDFPPPPTYFLTPKLVNAWAPHVTVVFGTQPVSVTGANVAIPAGPADALAASQRFSLTAGAGLNTNSLLRGLAFVCIRGSSAPMGGFKLRWRFGLTQYNAGARCFIGLWNSIAAQPFTTADPSNLTNVFFLGFDDTDTTWQIMHNDNTLTCTKVDTTLTIAVNVLLELVIEASPSAGTIEWELHNLQAGTSFSGSVNSNLPQNTIPLVPAMQIGTAASGAQNRLDHVSMFIEAGPEP